MKGDVNNGDSGCEGQRGIEQGLLDQGSLVKIAMKNSTRTKF